jgi:hypothetical protein
VSDAKIEVEGARADIHFEASLLKGHELSTTELPSVVTFKEGGAQKAIKLSVPLKRKRSFR